LNNTAGIVMKEKLCTKGSLQLMKEYLHSHKCLRTLPGNRFMTSVLGIFSLYGYYSFTHHSFWYSLHMMVQES